MPSGYNPQKFPFGYEAAKGNDNVSSIFLFGRNTDVDAAAEEYITDFWAGSYPFLENPEELYISSSSASDTNVVVVMRTLDTDWNVKDVAVQLDGHTKVQVPGGPFMRVLIAFNGGAVDQIGDVYIYRDVPNNLGVPADLTQVLMKVDAVKQQSSAAIYTVPAGFTCYITSLALTVNRNAAGGSADITLNSKAHNGVRRRRADLGLQTAGSSSFNYNFDVPLVIKEKNDIFLSAQVDNNNHDLAGGFQTVIVRN